MGEWNTGTTCFLMLLSSCHCCTGTGIGYYKDPFLFFPTGCEDVAMQILHW